MYYSNSTLNTSDRNGCEMVNAALRKCGKCSKSPSFSPFQLSGLYLSPTEIQFLCHSELSANAFKSVKARIFVVKVRLRKNALNNRNPSSALTHSHTMIHFDAPGKQAF